MPLLAGTRIGSYEITGALGAGGMGEVYRARDTRVKRDVAVKVLPELFARDADRLARFRREAQVLASLNHPNIAALYGVEDSDAGRALVMELVEGPTLADLISRVSAKRGRSGGGLPLDEVLSIARQVTAALEAAHDHGLIHRDLKPGNIKVATGGTVKVLDFGLAKIVAPDDDQGSSGDELPNSPTITSAGTRLGVILGTAGYMSPEQARGKPLDKRTDIWAFGCVLYEMLTGRPAFDGDEISDVLARIIEREPDFAALPATTPASVRRLLRRCLEKDRKRRLSDFGDARLEIDEAASGAAESASPASSSSIDGPTSFPTAATSSSRSGAATPIARRSPSCRSRAVHPRS
jgi:serine/threonine protein kinase